MTQLAHPVSYSPSAIASQASLDISASYRYCEGIARKRRHNFPVGSLFAPSDIRPHIFAIYAFFRTADDIMNEPTYEGKRARVLDQWEDRLTQCYFGTDPTHPVLVALMDTVSRFSLPISNFTSIVSALRSDLEVTRYATYTDLRQHLDLLARPLFSLFLRVGEQHNDELQKFAGDLAVGMAETKFWQDIAADANRGRIYLPFEDCKHFGVTEADIFHLRKTKPFDALIRYQVARTRSVLTRARPLIEKAGPKLAVELALSWLGSWRILEKVEKLGSRVVTNRPTLRALDKSQIVIKAATWRNDALYWRALRRRSKIWPL